MAEKVPNIDVGFGALKNDIADQFTKKDVLRVAHYFELPPAVIDQLEQPRDELGLFFLGILEQRGLMSSQDLSKLTNALDYLGLRGISLKIEKFGEQHLQRVKEKEAMKSSESEEMLSHEAYPYLTKEQFENCGGNKDVMEIMNKIQRPIHERKMKSYDLAKRVPITGSREDIDHIRIVMIGKTGSGKSATANTILGENKFTESDSSVSETMSSCIATAKLSPRRRVTVVDTPGLKDTGKTDEDIIKEIARIAYLLRDGVHAFVFVRNASDNRFSGGDEQVYNTIKKGFGERFKDHCFLVCSKADAVLKDRTLDDFIESQRKHTDVRSFLDEMDMKIVALDNTTDIPAERKRNQDVIVEIVDNMLHKSGNRPYTNELFEKALELHHMVEEKAKLSGWHPALVAAVIEVFDSYTSFELTEEVLYQTVLNVLKKSKTGSVDDVSGKVTLMYETNENILDSSDCENEVKLIFRSLSEAVDRLSKFKDFLSYLSTLIFFSPLGVTGTLLTLLGQAVISLYHSYIFAKPSE